jgi:hypothetical protein
MATPELPISEFTRSPEPGGEGSDEQRHETNARFSQPVLERPEAEFWPPPDDEALTQPTRDFPQPIAGDQQKPPSANHEDASEDAALEIEIEIEKIIKEIGERRKPQFHSTGVLGPTLIPGELRRMAERRTEKRKSRRPE